MKGRTHLTVGLGIGVVASFTQPIEAMPVLLAASGLASLAPDLDGKNLLNRRITKTAKLIKKRGVFVGGLFILLSLAMYFLNLNNLPFLDESWLSWLGEQNEILLFGWGAVIVGFSLKNLETLKNTLMSIIGAILLYYAFTNELPWLMMLALYIGGVGWFAHRGPTHTIWALIYWGYMSYLLEENTGLNGLALTSTVAYLSHIVGDMLTKQGVKFLSPVMKKVFRIG